MKRLLILLAFLMIFLGSSFPASAVTLPFSDGFEGYSAGAAPPPPWLSFAGGPGTVTSAKAHTGLKSLMVSGGPASPQSSVVDLGASYPDFLQYEGWVNNDGGAGIIGFHEQVANQTSSFNAVAFKTNRELYFTSADATTGFNIFLGSGLTLGWHYIKVQLDFQTLHGNVWVDGNLVGNQLPISPRDVVFGGSPVFLRHVGIIHTGDSTVYLDDFAITACPNPGPSANVSPLNGEPAVSPNPTLTWSGVSNADFYDVYFGTSPNPEYLARTNNTSYHLYGLSYLTTYYWQIVAGTNCGTSTPGAIWSYTTAPTCPIVLVPYSLNPANSATGVSVNVTLSWAAAGYADSYDVYLGTTPDPPLVGSTANLSYTSSKLNYRTTYYWKILAKNICGNSTAGPLRSFTTASCTVGAPSSPSPANNATGVSTNPTLTWSAGANADSYDVYFGTSSNPPFVANTTNLSYLVSGLGYLTKYYWKVVAKGSCGNTSSSVWSFTTAPCTYSVFPLSQSFSGERGSGSVNVTAGAACCWTASADPGSWDWIGVSSGASGCGTWTINYFLLPNTTGATRTGTMTIAGQTFTITQSPLCAYALSPASSAFGKNVGFGAVNVTADSGCLWSAAPNPGSSDWVGVSSGSNGAGNGTVYYYVLANNTGQDRAGTLAIAGKTFTVTQSGSATGSCSTYTISPPSQNFSSDAGSGVVNVTADQGCLWSAWTNRDSWDWIGISSGWNGTGNGSVTYSVLPNNTGATRTGTIVVAGQTFTITQSPACAYTISPTSNTFGKNMGFGVVNVTADAGCSWSALTNRNSWTWIGISSGSNGTGNGTVYYYVLANNTGKDRTGTLAIAGKTFTITQSGTATGSCSAYTISPTSQNFSKDAGSGVVNVTADTGCLWSAWTSPASSAWITISSGSNGAGDGSVNYVLLPNSSLNTRTGTLTIAGQTFTITQSGTCAYTISPTSRTFSRDAASATVSVSTSAGCAWSASTDSGSWDWIGISSGRNGTGNGTVNYFVLENSTGQDRSGKLTIAGKTFTVLQGGSSAPSSDSFLLSDDFDQYPANQPPPSPWLSMDLKGLPGIVTDQACQSGERCLILSGGPDASQSAVVDIGDSYEPYLSYEVSIKFAAANSGGFVGFFEDIDNEAPEFNSVYLSGWDGKVYFTSSDQYHPVHLLLAQGFEIGIWNRVRVDLNFETLTGNVYLNDVLIGDSLPISPRDATWGPNTFRLRKVGMLHSLGEGVYFDDFSVITRSGK